MVIVTIECGLGNQMFEYAFLCAIKNKFPEIEVKIDNKYNIVEPEHNGYELDRVFGIQCQECTKQEVRKLTGYVVMDKWYSIFIRKYYSFLKRIFGELKSYCHQKDYTAYYPEVFEFDSSKSRAFRGIWANEKYFSGISKQVCEQFEFVLPKDEQNAKIAEQIAKCNSVSIHVRKGDYVQAGNHVLDNLYYDKAIEIIESKVEKPVYFVFSDDLNYAREIFKKLNNVIYVSGNIGQDSWKDMWLMSICKHNIIANSSFSFWGAYLNKNKDKLVIASKIPFKGCSSPFACDDWIKI